jgi:uncharacterized protein YutE (UPF0331/DUF86 family)
MKEDIKNKPFFVIALLTSFLAFAIFKDDLSKIIINFGLFKLSFLVILIIFYIVLALSIYFFSINFLWTGTKFENNFILKHCYNVGVFLYALALLLPFVFLITWLIGLILNAFGNFMASKTHGILNVSTLLLLLAVVVLASIKSAIESLQEENKAIKKYGKLADEKMERTLVLKRKGLYSETIISLCSSLEFNLRRRLVEKGFSTGDKDYMDLIDLAKKKKILSEQSWKILLDLRNSRNKVVHYGEAISREEMEKIFATVKEVLREVNVE